MAIGVRAIALTLAACAPDGGPRPPEAFPDVVYIHADHRGAPVLATDSARSVVWSAHYDPFGTIHVASGAKFTLNLRLPGQYESSGERFASGREMYYNWHRYYDPNLGRYLQPEPMLTDPSMVPYLSHLEPGHLEAYPYAANNPLRYVDPNGYSYVEPSWADPDQMGAAIGSNPAGALLAAAAMVAAAAMANRPDNVKPNFPPAPLLPVDSNRFNLCGFQRSICNQQCEQSDVAQCLGSASMSACKLICDVNYQLCIRSLF